MFLDTGIEQVAGHIIRERHWGWDGACLESVSAIAHDPLEADQNLYRYWNVAGAAGGGAAGGWGGAHEGLCIVGWFSDCADANNDVMECFAACGIDADHNQNDPEWHCARQGRFVTIGYDWRRRLGKATVDLPAPPCGGG